MARGPIVSTLVRRHRADEATLTSPDDVVVEEPLEIRLDGHPVATTMRTPGHDFELGAGFLHAEGALAGAAIQRIRYCDGPCGPGETTYNTITVETGGRAPVPTPRLGTVTSACGVCGSTAVDELCLRLPRMDHLDPPSLQLVEAVVGAAEAAAPLFARTGAVHAAAAFDVDTGELVVVREDIGRHNALDKVVGRLLLDGALHTEGRRLGAYVSGRASFELVQKAWAAGFPLLVAVSGPSALAVTTAKAAGLVLVGFARAGRMNVYA